MRFGLAERLYFSTDQTKVPHIGGLISALGVFSWPIAPQTSPEFRAGVTVVNVPCVVRDHHCGVLTDLNRDDFDVFDGGKKQEIRYFARLADVPLAVGLLLDPAGV